MIAVLFLLMVAAGAARFALAGFAHHQAAGVLAGGLVAVLALWPLRWLAWQGRALPRNRPRVMRWRLRLGVKPGADHANWAELVSRWGRFAAWRRSKVTRPSLPRLRRYLRVSEHCHLVGWAYGWHRLLVPFEEHMLLIAPPRSYKTALLGKMLQRFGGPAVVTSTKPDLFALTSGLRAGGGRPVHVFNPQGFGGVPSTFAWSPLDGADAEAVAIRRADAFAATVSQKGVEEGSFWSQKCSDCLRALFMAAALGEYDMRRVYAWVQGDSVAEPAQILADAGKPDWAGVLAQMGSDARKTAATVKMSMSRALQFLADPKLAQSVLPGPGAGLDIAAFLRQCGTIFLIAESAGGDEAPVAALFAALAAEIRFQAALLGSMGRHGRLDPPLLMALDEATQICPCPIPSWVADSGGKGIQIITVAQGEARLRERWGRDGAQTLVDCSGVKAIFGGVADTATLEAFSRLCGDTSYDQQGRRGEAGQSHLTQHAVMTAAMIRRLPRIYALFVRADCSPVIAHVPVAWRDLRYRRAKFTGRAVADVRPVAAAAPVPARPVGLAPWPAIQDPQDAQPALVPPWVSSGNGNGHGHAPAGGDHDAL